MSERITTCALSVYMPVRCAALTVLMETLPRSSWRWEAIIQSKKNTSLSLSLSLSSFFLFPTLAASGTHTGKVGGGGGAWGLGRGLRGERWA